MNFLKSNISIILRFIILVFYDIVWEKNRVSFFLFGLLVLLSDARYITKYNLTVSIFLFVFAFRFHIFRSFSSLFKLRCTVILQNNSCHSEHLDDSFFIFCFFSVFSFSCLSDLNVFVLPNPIHSIVSVGCYLLEVAGILLVYL